MRRIEIKEFYVILLLTLLFAAQAYAEDGTPFRLIQTIPLQGVKGRIDHMAADVKGNRLFVAALGNNSLEVVDLRAGKRIRQIRGLQEPQGVAYVDEFNKIFLTNGGDGSCKVFDGDSFHLVETIKFSNDADNVRYDPLAKYVYVGYGNGALGIVDASIWKHIGDIPLSGHPESFQLEGSGPKVFVNVPGAKNITVADRMKRVVIGTWTVEGARGNFPMAMDESSRRLLIGCRQPPKMVVYDTESGKEVTRFDIAGDVDDIFFDSARKRIYASSGEGFLNVLQQIDADHYSILAKTSTAAGARTSLFVPGQGRLYVAVPHRDGRQAEIRVYATGH